MKITDSVQALIGGISGWLVREIGFSLLLGASPKQQSIKQATPSSAVKVKTGVDLLWTPDRMTGKKLPRRSFAP